MSDNDRPHNLFIVETVKLSEAYLPDGRRYEVVATRHNRVWPGTDSPWTFAVYSYSYREGGFYGIHDSWGFFEQADTYKFLTSYNEYEYPVWDQYGEQDTTVRRGLGVPDGYVISIPYQL